jgi:hypothetical protein
MLVVMLSIAVYSHYQPFLADADDNLATFAQWALLMTLFAGLLGRTRVTTDDGYDDDSFGSILVLVNSLVLGGALSLGLYDASGHVTAETWMCFTSTSSAAASISVAPLTQRDGDGDGITNSDETKRREGNNKNNHGSSVHSDDDHNARSLYLTLARMSPGRSGGSGSSSSTSSQPSTPIERTLGHEIRRLRMSPGRSGGGGSSSSTSSQPSTSIEHTLGHEIRRLREENMIDEEIDEDDLPNRYQYLTRI